MRISLHNKEGRNCVCAQVPEDEFWSQVENCTHEEILHCLDVNGKFHLSSALHPADEHIWSSLAFASE